MKIGIVLSSLPLYSETFFISKIEGLQKCGFEVVLFVGYGNKNFDLCKVKSSAIQPNNLISLIMSRTNEIRRKIVQESDYKVLKTDCLKNFVLGNFLKNPCQKIPKNFISAKFFFEN